jgi:hypothetical protein
MRNSSNISHMINDHIEGLSEYSDFVTFYWWNKTVNLQSQKFEYNSCLYWIYIYGSDRIWIKYTKFVFDQTFYIHRRKSLLSIETFAINNHSVQVNDLIRNVILYRNCLSCVTEISKSKLRYIVQQSNCSRFLSNYKGIVLEILYTVPKSW